MTLYYGVMYEVTKFHSLGPHAIPMTGEPPFVKEKERLGLRLLALDH
jgi:hypothetical protein